MKWGLDVIPIVCCLVFLPLVIMAQEASPSSPCQSQGHDEFDFWVGKWAVFVPGTDSLLGHNHIRRTMKGCVVEEHWTGATGFTGKSFNTYNPSDSSWSQVWVDQSGAEYHFMGRKQGQVMQLYSQAGNLATPTLFDMSYTYDSERDIVLQHWQMSRDFGKSWSTVFLGEYRREKE